MSGWEARASGYRRDAEGRVYWLRPFAGGWAAAEHLDHAVVRQARRYHRHEAQAVAEGWIEERRAEAFDRAQLGILGGDTTQERAESASALWAPGGG